MLSGEKICVTRLAASPNKRHIAVGYADGTVKIFDLISGENVSVFVGHKSEITALAYDAFGTRLATGSKVRMFYRQMYHAIQVLMTFFCNITGYRYHYLGCCSRNRNMSINWAQRCYN